MPEVVIVDLRQELANGNRSIISKKLHDEIQENLKNKKQTILFLNRRGFSTFVMCRNCGYTAKCKRCKHWNYCGGDSLHTWNFDENKPNICLKPIFDEL